MKYNNKKTEINGIPFDSLMESRYYIYLQKQIEAGFVQSIDLQPTYLLIPNFTKDKHTIRKIIYKADFLVIYTDGSSAVIDIKGVETKDFKLKAKLFHYFYPDLELKIITEYKGEWIPLKDKPKRKKSTKGKRTIRGEGIESQPKKRVRRRSQR